MTILMTIFMKKTQRFVRAAAMLLACAILLTAYAQAASNDPDTVITLPEPENTDAGQIIGEHLSPTVCDIRLYYPTGNGTSVSNVTRTFEYTDIFTLFDDVFAALTSVGELNDINLIGTEFSRGILHLDLSIDVLALQEEKQRLALVASVVNTYLEIDGVSAVGLSVGGRADSLFSLPIGTYTEPIENVTVAAAQLQAESERYLESGAEPIERNCVLYYSSADGHYLLPEVHEISLSGDGLIRVVIDELCAGATDSRNLTSLLTDAPELLLEEPTVRVTGAGLRIAELNLSDIVVNYLALSGAEAWQLYGSIVLSVCGFVPEIDAVRICLSGDPVRECTVRGQTESFDDGIMYRRNFARYIGESAYMYFCDGDETVVRRGYTLAQKSAHSPFGVLSAMLDAKNTFFPEGVSSADLLGISVSDRVATVNLSGNFYAACQSATESRERLIAYSVINTLCELRGISAVRFLIEGRSVETLSDDIYLKAPLMPDPGFAAPDTSVEP